MPVKSNREYRDVSNIEVRKSEEAEERNMVVEGYATVFNAPYTLYQDDDFVLREIVDAGAFAEADMSDVIMQYNHEGRVFARQSNGTLEVAPDETGLHISADLSGTELGRQLYEEIDGGYTDKMSFGFTVSRDEWLEGTEEDGRAYATRTILSIGKLYDVSAVSIPANDATSISVRNLTDGVFERITAERQKREAMELRRRKMLMIAKGGKND